MFIARKSNHIQADIARNWSSWNFGEDGVFCTKEELDAAIENIGDGCLYISGFEIYADQLEDFTFGELYPGYWVAIDNTNAKNGLSAIQLSADTNEEAIIEANTRSDYFGDGISFDASNAKLIYSNKDIHIFEI